MSDQVKFTAYIKHVELSQDYEMDTESILMHLEAPIKDNVFHNFIKPMITNKVEFTLKDITPKKIKYGNIEFRQIDGTNDYEIVKRHDVFHSAPIAVWKYSLTNGYDLRFINNRPFNNSINHHDFWRVAKEGQEYLDGLSQSTIP